MKPLEIIAHLGAGYASYEPWTPMLDAMLEFIVFRGKTGGIGNCHEKAINTEIPLEKKFIGTDWMWACSWPIANNATGESVINYNKRFDVYHAVNHADMEKTKRIMTQAGPYKSHRIPLRIIMCSSLSWFVMGNGDEIKPLLDGLHFIGKRYSHGLGQVVKWEIKEAPENKSVLHDGRLMRNIPFDRNVKEQIASDSWYEAELAIRPPYWHQSRVRKCMVPHR